MANSMIDICLPQISKVPSSLVASRHGKESLGFAPLGILNNYLDDADAHVLLISLPAKSAAHSSSCINAV